MNTWDYIERLRSKLADQGESDSDYRISQVLGVTRGALSHYRSKAREADDETAAKIAELLGIPPGRVIADIRIGRAKADGNAVMASVWESIRAKFPVVTPMRPAKASATMPAALSAATGRGLKIRRGNPPWEFDSPLRHQSHPFPIPGRVPRPHRRRKHRQTPRPLPMPQSLPMAA